MREIAVVRKETKDVRVSVRAIPRLSVNRALSVFCGNAKFAACSYSARLKGACVSDVFCSGSFELHESNEQKYARCKDDCGTCLGDYGNE